MSENKMPDKITAFKWRHYLKDGISNLWMKTHPIKQDGEGVRIAYAKYHRDDLVVPISELEELIEGWESGQTMFVDRCIKDIQNLIGGK